MNILVTGATGTIGGAVADALAAAGHAVSGLARTWRAVETLEARGLRAVRGDLADPAGLAEVAAGFDAVAWAADSRDPGVDGAAIAAVLRGLEHTDKAFVYTSGVWVHGDTHGQVADETTPLDPPALVGWRPAIERQVLEAPGVRGVVVRPGVVYGRGAAIPAMLTASARELGAARHVGDGQNRWAVVYADDLADLYVRVLERAAAGSVWIAVQSPSVRQLDVARAASRGAGADGRTLAWPLSEARGALGAFADALALDQQATSRRAEALLGWHPRGPTIVEELRGGGG